MKGNKRLNQEVACQCQGCMSDPRLGHNKIQGNDAANPLRINTAQQQSPY